MVKDLSCIAKRFLFWILLACVWGVIQIGRRRHRSKQEL